MCAARSRPMITLPAPRCSSVDQFPKTTFATIERRSKQIWSSSQSCSIVSITGLQAFLRTLQRPLLQRPWPMAAKARHSAERSDAQDEHIEPSDRGGSGGCRPQLPRYLPPSPGIGSHPANCQARANDHWMCSPATLRHSDLILRDIEPLRDPRSFEPRARGCPAASRRHPLPLQRLRVSRNHL